MNIVARQVEFYPAIDGRGKWHAANPVIETAACGVPVILDEHGTAPIIVGPLDTRVHPICCRRCLRTVGR